jgi:nucleotide-binding universal stress UspA family protein
VLGDLRFHRLLIPVDGSGASWLALSAGVRIAQRDHATLTLLTAVAAGARWGGPWAPVVPGVPEAEACAEAEARLRAAASRIPAGIGVRLIVREGRPGPVIVEEADPARYDAIVMGARGGGRLHALLGSTTGYVLKRSAVTVFTAHPGAAEHLGTVPR